MDHISLTSSKMWVKEKILGTGGFGVVTLWHNSETDVKIALKRCRWNGAGGSADNLLSTKHIERWEKEVEIMNRLDHNAVVKCFPVPPEFVQAVGDLPMLCMEFCSGGDLRKILNRPENCCGLSEPVVRSCLRDVSEAVSYLHSLRIIHRDLKPENIVLQDIDGQVTYKLIDLGYAKELEHGSACTSFVGTLQYLAPELFLSKRYSCTVDYWSMGLLAHELVTGLRPFLPTKTPIEWMKQVKDKKRDHISVYEDQDGSVVFSSTIFPENQISLPFKTRLEEWLRVVLEWDPAIRGRSVPDGKEEKELIVFSSLSELLSKKVIKVLVLETCEFLQYEVTDSDSIEDVQRWIHRDTRVTVEDQRPLLPRGQPPDASRSATQCWAPSDEDEWVLFVFSDATGRPHLPPRFPPSVEEMLRQSKRVFDYRSRRRMWSHSIFFLKTESRLLSLLSQAQKTASLHLASCHSQLAKARQKMLSGIAKLQARHNLFLESLNADLTSYEEQVEFGVSSQNLYRGWSEMGEMSLKQLQTIIERVQQMEGSLTALSTKMLEVQNSPFARANYSDSLASIIEASYELYSTLRKKSAEERCVEEANTDMCKLLVQALRKRDKVHHDVYKHLDKLNECLSEVLSLTPLIESAIEEIARLAQKISSLQSKRQRDIWKVMEIALKKVNHGENYQSSDAVPTSNQSSSSPDLSTSEASLLKRLQSHLDASASQSRSLISENRLLRSQMMELLSVLVPSTLNVSCSKDS